MNRLQTALYVYETVRRIPCSYRCQMRMMLRARRFVKAFFQENPDADREDLTEAFGEPADFAQSLLEYVDKNDRAEEFRRKSWSRRAIVVLLSALALCCGVFCAFLSVRDSK